jgi:hypothetical protein
MEPITLSLILAGIGLATGGASGAGAAINRKNELDNQQRILGYQYDAAQKQKAAQRSILEGNLSIETIDSNAAKKRAAMEAAAAEGQARAAAGTSGASAGTPFYALDKQMFANHEALQELDYKVSAHQIMTKRQFEAGAISMDAQLGTMGLQAAQLNKDVDYAGSFMGFLMPTLSGAASGASAGLSVANTLIGAGFTTEAVNPGHTPARTDGFSQTNPERKLYRPDQSYIYEPQKARTSYEKPQSMNFSSNFFAPSLSPGLTYNPNAMPKYTPNLMGF